MTTVVGDGGIRHWRKFDELSLHPILHAALDVFVERGYHGATVRAIADRAGLTVPAIYYHFPNKQALLVELMLKAVGEALERSKLAQAEAGQHPVRQFAALIEAIVLFVIYRQPLALLDRETRGLEAANRERYGRPRAELQGLIYNSIVQARNEGAVATRHPRQAARAVLAMCQSVATWYHDDGPLSPEQIATYYVELALSTIGQNSPRGNDSPATV